MIPATLKTAMINMAMYAGAGGRCHPYDAALLSLTVEELIPENRRISRVRPVKRRTTAGARDDHSDRSAEVP
ncbi:hypothetical protein GCM10009753_72840 [Streptantibioticus ferralitis]